MGYINKKTEALVNVKLTDIGRKNLASGNLNFSQYALGDGEINYQNNNKSLINILRPEDGKQGIIYQIPSEDTTFLNPIYNITNQTKIISGTTKERGFYVSGTTNFNSDYSKVHALKITLDAMSGTTTLVADSFSGTTISGNSIDINNGDLILIKITNPYFNETIQPDGIEDKALPHAWFEIENTISGYTGGTITLTLDRVLPDFSSVSGASGYTTYAYIYPSTDSMNYYDKNNPTAYWSDDLINFNSTCSNPLDDVGVWNMNIVHIEDVIGLNELYNKGKTESIGYHYQGIYTYFKYIENNPEITKLGVIHYSNNTVNNFYGEGFYNTGFSITIPNLMWHKKQFSGPGTGTKMGYTFICDNELKHIDNTVKYYDLVDQELNKSVVGKVFPELKICVIEDPELLMAMSIKSNRNWTLPKPNLTLVDTGICDNINTNGAISQGETLHVTYMLKYSNGSLGSWMDGIHCENYSSITLEENNVKDVMFSFPFNSNNNLYNEFPYLNINTNNTNFYGWGAKKFYILLQKTENGNRPNPNEWTYFDATNYIGGNGCINVNKLIGTNDIELNNQTVIVSDPDTLSYTLNEIPLGDVLVSVNGVVQKKATTLTNVFDLPTTHPSYNTYKDVMGDYFYLEGSNQITFELNQDFYASGHPLTNLSVGDVITFHYLTGIATSGVSYTQNIVVPNTIPIATGGSIYLDTPISSSVTINTPSPAIDLDYTPSGDVYLIYNGQLLSDTNYFVVNNSGITRIELNFVPPQGSNLVLYYLTNNTIINSGDITATKLNNTKLYLNYDVINSLATQLYDVNDFNPIPDSNSSGFTFGDEVMFFGNINADIKATIFKSKIRALVLPNRYTKSNNPTFNPNLHTVSFSEIGIYDSDNDLVAIGKFSEPLVRNNNSDLLTIEATIDF